MSDAFGFAADLARDAARESTARNAAITYAEQVARLMSALTDAGRTIHGTHSDMPRYRGESWDRCGHALCRVHQRRVRGVLAPRVVAGGGAA